MRLEDKLNASFDPNTPVDMLVQFASDESRDVRVNTVVNPSLPSSVRARMAIEDDDIVVRVQAIRHNKWSLAEFEEFVRIPSVMIKAAVASNIHTPVSILKLLFQETTENVMQALAANPNTPEAWLDRYNTPKYRRYLATNPNAPVYLLEELAFDKDYAVRQIVAGHKNMPVRILEKMAEENDDYYSVVNAAICNANMLLPNIEKLTNSKKTTTRALTTHSPHITPQLLHKLSKDKEVRVRVEVMVCKNATPGIVLSFLRDENNAMREDAQKYIEAWEDHLFYEGIEELGYSHLSYLPRNWIMKAIS